jgi:AcrR family transcriptional regulator
MAERVFAERGFSGATMNEIATRAGYSVGNLYHLFDHKAALYQEILAWRSREYLEEQLAAVEQPGGYGEVFDLAMSSMLRFCRAHRDFWVLYVRATTGQDASGATLNAEVNAMREELERKSIERLEQAMRDGEVAQDDPVVCATLVSGGLLHLIVRWIEIGGSDEELEAASTVLRRLLRRSLGMEP